MKNAFIIFIAVLTATFLFLAITALILYIRIKRKIPKEEIEMFRQAMKEETVSDKEIYSTKKTIMGLTNILEPKIRKDFPDFNLNHFYSEVESNLRDILNAKNDLNVKDINEEKLIYIKGGLAEEIENMKTNNITEKFQDIAFGSHVIKNYEKKNGTATITVASQVSYVYDSNKNNKIYQGLRKETVYISEYIYVIDELQYKDHVSISIHCPNCNAPYDKYDGGNCSYCGIYIKPINLKGWKMASYKEEYHQ